MSRRWRWRRSRKGAVTLLRSPNDHNSQQRCSWDRNSVTAPLRERRHLQRRLTPSHYTPYTCITTNSRTSDNISFFHRFGLGIIIHILLLSLFQICLLEHPRDLTNTRGRLVIRGVCRQWGSCSFPICICCVQFSAGNLSMSLARKLHACNIGRPSTFHDWCSGLKSAHSSTILLVPNATEQSWKVEDLRWFI